MSSTNDDENILKVFLLTTPCNAESVIRYERIFSFLVVSSSEEKAREYYPYIGDEIKIVLLNDNGNRIWQMMTKDDEVLSLEQRDIFTIANPWISADKIQHIKVKYIQNARHDRTEGQILDIYKLRRYSITNT